MASATPHTITLRGDPIASEAISAAASAIKPGMLCEINSSGKIRPHSVAGGRAIASFAREMDIIGAGIDDIYDDGDTVLYSIFRPGDWVYALLKDEANVALGAFLESDGAGALQPLDTAVSAQASVTLGTGNAAVKFTAANPGVSGNDVQVQILAATAATATVTVTGNLIQIKPNSTTPGTTDLASTVVTLVNGDVAARALVVASNPGTGGSAIVSPVAATNLSGGAETVGKAVARTLEAVDGTGLTGPVRIKVEVL